MVDLLRDEWRVHVTVFRWAVCPCPASPNPSIGTACPASALVIDKAQRLKRSSAHGLPADLADVLARVPAAVIFLDERQIIRPDEGTTVKEIRTAPEAWGRTKSA